MSSPVPIYSLSSRIDAHGLWFLLLVSQFILFMAYVLTSVLIPSYSILMAQLSFGCASLAYLLVLWKTFGRPRFNSQYWTSVALTENFAYLTITSFFTLSRFQLISVILPLSIYSIFHIISYCRTSILTHPYVRSKLNTSTVADYTQKCITFEKKYQIPLLLNAAVIEILNMPLMTFLTLVGSGSLVSLVIYWQFLLIRYASSAQTQNAFKLLRSNCDYYTSNPRFPGFLAKAYVRGRDYLSQWADGNEFIKAVRIRNEVRETRGR